MPGLARTSLELCCGSFAVGGHLQALQGVLAGFLHDGLTAGPSLTPPYLSHRVLQPCPELCMSSRASH